MTDLAVVIVTWNVRELALDAIRSLNADLDTSGLLADIYVVDNASDDGTVDAVAAQFPHLHLITCSENLGFGAANNLALRQIGFGTANKANLPKAVYLLNCDTITQPGATLDLFESLMSNPDWGLVGAQLSYGDGSFQHSAFSFPDLRQLWVEFFPTPGRFINGRFNGRYPRYLYNAGQPFSIDFTLGATMMLRREVIQETGMFDEQFFMYCEEIDWAWRIRKAGWQVYCVPSAHVIHLAGQSTVQVRPQSIVNLWTSRLRLFAKHYPTWKFAVARWMIRAGMRLRMRQVRKDVESADQEALVSAYQSVYERAMLEA